MSDQPTFRVTAEDLAAQDKLAPAPSPAQPATPGVKSYGSIHAAPDAPSTQKASLLLQGWFYLGASGLAGALAGWAITEHAFVDGPGHRWGNLWMLPLLIALMCLGFAIAESVVERSTRKALLRAAAALPLGLLLGLGFDRAANLFYAIAMLFAARAGAHSYHNPALWIIRGLAWAIFGAAGGVVYGIVGQSSKKTGYGVLGGAIGAAIGGLVFDPISFATHGGAASRAVGFGLLGLSTGIAMGLVESALKHRWLYVTAGPLAGKQFILYKPVTTIGSLQTSDIYLFKDAEILPQHARLQMHGARVHLHADAPVFVAGQPVRGVRVLESGVILQIGRYHFRYQEKQRS